MNKKRLYFAGLGILLLIVVYYLIKPETYYGNDSESIVKAINSIEGYEDKAIEILEIRDIKDKRIVAILSNNSPGYVEFNKNEDGNYVWRYIEVRENEALSSFLPTHSEFMFVTSSSNEIARMEVSVNGEEVVQEFTPKKAQVVWTKLPEDDKGQLTFRNYRFYGQDGNLIDDHQ